MHNKHCNIPIYFASITKFTECNLNCCCLMTIMMARIIPITLVAFVCVTLATPAKLTKELNLKDLALENLQNINIRQEIENFIIKSPGIVNIVELFNTKSNPEASEVLEAFNKGIGFKLLTVKNGFVQANINNLPFQRSIQNSEVGLVKVPVINFGKALVQSRASIFDTIYQTVCTTVTSVYSQLNNTLTTFLNTLKSIDISAGNNFIAQVLAPVLNVVLGLLQNAINLLNQMVETIFGNLCTSSSRKRRDLEEADSALVNFKGDINTRLVLVDTINGVLSIVVGLVKVLVKIVVNNTWLVPILLLFLISTLL